MPPSSPASSSARPVDLGDGDAAQALGELLERRPAGQHRRDEPLARSGDVPAAYPRQQPGAHDAGLAGSGSADDQHQPARQVVAPEAGEDLVDEVGPTEEVGGVGLVERPQPLVGVRPRRVGGDVSTGERGDEHRDELRHRRPADRRHATGEDVRDGVLVAGDAPLHHLGEVVLVVADGQVRGTQREVAEVRVAGIVEQHALRDDPAVDDPLLGRRDQRPADAAHQRRHLDPRQRPAIQAIGQRPAGHPAHDQIGRARLPPVVVDRHDGGVVQRCHPVHGRLERAHELGTVGDLRADHPYREVALQPRQPGGVHRAVATGAEALAEPIPAQRQPGRRGEHQRRVVGEDPLLELHQRGRRVEAELLDEHLAMVPQDAERVRLATGAIERDHELGLERLAERVRTGERLDLGDHLRRPAARQLGLDQPLVGDEPQLFEPLGLRARPVLVGELGVRVAPPERQRLAQHRRRPRRRRRVPTAERASASRRSNWTTSNWSAGSRSTYPGAWVTRPAPDPFPSTALRSRAT